LSPVVRENGRQYTQLDSLHNVNINSRHNSNPKIRSATSSDFAGKNSDFNKTADLVLRFVKHGRRHDIIGQTR